ncbi:hypothetical protein RF11_09595 [Thelohanellus kitauei]|uniref:Uncharacterized protein n=1 Tax=Thelohanellus kitauei TaxID=669202 RepID=A0A0C2IZP1_THEKT|nr:hypothetical protein RF11_09595 [Thelohanellus kitauei]
MEPENYMDTQIKLAFERYSRDAQSELLVNKMKAVKNFMLNFSNLNLPEKYIIFIDHFPKDVYMEFEKVSEIGQNAEDYKKEKTFFFEVYNFIIEYLISTSHPEAQSFVRLFLKYIKISEYQYSYNINTLLNSIEPSIAFEHNKIFFINENIMFYFYNCFPHSTNSSTQRFRKMCKRICNIDPTNRSSLCCIKLRDNVNQIMDNYYETDDERYAWILFIILRMIHRLGLMGVVEFNMSVFYDVTNSIFYDQIVNGENFKLLSLVSKTWSSILNQSKKRIHIDTTSKLIHLAAIFAIDLFRKLKNILKKSGRLVFIL